MKTIKNLRKLAVILLGLLGISSFLASCNKEQDCECTLTYSYTYGGQTYTYTDKVDVTVEGKCESLELDFEGPVKADCKED